MCALCLSTPTRAGSNLSSDSGTPCFLIRPRPRLIVSPGSPASHSSDFSKQARMDASNLWRLCRMCWTWQGRAMPFFPRQRLVLLPRRNLPQRLLKHLDRLATLDQVAVIYDDGRHRVNALLQVELLALTHLGRVAV